jgi:hypothetical protein
MAKRNYKVTCVGLTEEAQPARLTFYVYGAESVEEARTQVRADKYNRRVMTGSNINYETVELHVLRCSATGEISEKNKPSEQSILMKENAELDRLHTAWRRARHPHLEPRNEW